MLDVGHDKYWYTLPRPGLNLEQLGRSESGTVSDGQETLIEGLYYGPLRSPEKAVSATTKPIDWTLQNSSALAAPAGAMDADVMAKSATKS